MQALILLHAQVVRGVDERAVSEPSRDRVAEAFDEVTRRGLIPSGVMAGDFGEQ